MKLESYSNIAQMQEICDLFEKRNPLERLLQNTMLCSLLLNLYNDSESDRKVALSRQRTDQMIAYLQKHCEEKFSSVDIETYMGLSYKHLNDVFKKRNRNDASEISLSNAHGTSSETAAADRLNYHAD